MERKKKKKHISMRTRGGKAKAKTKWSAESARFLMESDSIARGVSTYNPAQSKSLTYNTHFPYKSASLVVSSNQIPR